MLTFDHITFRYPGTSQDVLTDVCLEIPQAGSVAILGANGSGKSTLAALAGGFLAPDEGSLLLDGVAVEGKMDAATSLNARVGVVFQDPTAQIVTNRVEDEVAFGPENLGLDVREVEARAARSLELTGLSAQAGRDPRDLSGGQLQRLVIAAALAMEPDYLFLDEPCAMLDEEGRAQMHDVIAHLKGSGMAVVLITHSLEEAALCDKAVVMQGGRVVFDGTMEELTSSAGLGAWGLVRKRVSATTHHPKNAGTSDISGAPDAGEYAELQQVDFSYEKVRGECQVLRGCSARFPVGQVSCLLGPNGSGKSTLLRLLAGLEMPQSGTVSICGKQAIPGTAGFCMQHPDMQLFADTVAGDVGFAPKQRKLPRQEIDDVVASCLSTVGLDPKLYAQRSPFSLSGGQARRAALAGILAVEGRFLLLDEPASGLDASGLDRLSALIEGLQSQGIGVVMACHDMAFAQEVSHNLFLVRDGKVVSVEPGEVCP